MIHRCFPLVLWFLLSVPVWAADNDGFGDAGKIEGQHFTIFYKPGVDVNHLIGQLNVTQSDEVLTGHTVDTSSAEKHLASKLDVLFNRTCDVLDMHVYSFKGNIKVFATQKELADFFDNLYHRELPCTGLSFYLFDFNSIYITAENFRREILGHEMGHGVMSNYFVVQPSVKIQEVLAGYVEYQLRKSK
jgi:hypothetical protein